MYLELKQSQRKCWESEREKEREKERARERWQNYVDITLHILDLFYFNV